MLFFIAQVVKYFVNNIRTLIVSFLILATLGCSAIPSLYIPELTHQETSLYRDELFQGYESMTIESEEDIYALSDEMKQLIEEHIKPQDSLKKRIHELISLIFDDQQIGLAYRNSANLTAQETFKNKEANCISLTILAYSLAQHIDLDVQFQDVKVPEYWVRNGQQSILTGHVNLTVSKKKLRHSETSLLPQSIEIDFDPYVRKQKFPIKRVDKNTVTAMFYTNKSAKAMIQKNYALAYAYLKKATLVSPTYSPAWGNLGVLYRKNNANELAINVYEHAISLDNKNLTSITNLAILFNIMGREEDAKRINTRLHTLRIKNPYYHALLGDTALYEGNIEEAVMHYKKAISLDGYNHLLYFGLTKAYVQKGDYALAQKTLKKAIKYNKHQSIEEKYYAKLGFLRQNHMHY